MTATAIIPTNSAVNALFSTAQSTPATFGLLSSSFSSTRSCSGRGGRCTAPTLLGSLPLPAADAYFLLGLQLGGEVCIGTALEEEERACCGVGDEKPNFIPNLEPE